MRAATFSIPSAAVFLMAAAVASDLLPSLTLSIGAVEVVATVALVVILFDGRMAIGLAVGALGGLFLRRVVGAPLVAVVALAFVVYGAATLAHGSGFLAVFVAGIVVGDLEHPSEQLQDRVASLAEIVVFV